MIFFNWLGMGWLIAGLGAAIGLQNAHVLVTEDGKYFGAVLALVIVAADVGYRYFVVRPRAIANGPGAGAGTRDVANHWLLGPGRGGSLMFLPAWSTAVAAGIIGIVIASL